MNRPTECPFRVRALRSPFASRLAACLLAALAAARGAAAASDGAVEKVLLLDTDYPTIVSPGIVDGRSDTLPVGTLFAVRLTDALRSLESGPPGSSETQFFVEWELTVLALDGATPILTMRRMEPILPPFVTTTFPGDPQEYVLVSSNQTWNGRDAEGRLAQDGSHAFTITGRTVRIDTPGHAATDGITAPREIESLTLHRDGSSMQLTWDEVTNEVFDNPSSVVGYNVYRGVRPDFLPDVQGGSNRILTTAVTAAVDAVDNSENLFYLVTAVDAANHESGVNARRRDIDAFGPHTGQVLVDDVPPAVTATAAPPPNANGWNRSDVTLAYLCTDSLSGVGFCPGPVTVTGDSVDQIVSRTAFDLAGNATTVDVRVRIDRIPPVAATPVPAPCPASIANPRPLVRACFNDARSGVDPGSLTLSVDGVDRTGQSTVSEGCISWTPSEDLAQGEHTAASTASDRAFNSGSVSWCFRVGPEVPTTVVGLVLDENGDPAAGAEVAVQVPVAPPPTGLTGSDGRFSIPDVPTRFGDIVVIARLERAGGNLVGQSGRTPAVPGGSTDVGTIRLRSDRTTRLFPGPVSDVGANPYAAAGADFNGDGKRDLAVADRDSNEVSILLGHGDGTFDPQLRFAVGTHPQSVAVADFNGDGKVDVATGNFDSSDVSVMLGAGDGTLNAGARLALTMSPFCVATADFNRDGKMDLAVGGVGVLLFLGHGDGTFDPAFSVSPVSASAMAAADFNGDGVPDIVLITGSSIVVLLDNGDATFTFHNTSTFFNRGLGVGDLNNDGKIDVVTVRDEADAHIVVAFYGSGDGRFAGGASLNVGLNPMAIAVGDVDGDGHSDLAVANFDSNDVSVLRGRGDGTLEPEFRLAAGGGPRSVVAEDFTGDSKADIAVANGRSNDVALVLCHTFGSAPLLPDGSRPLSPVVGDFDHDGNLDVAVANFGTTTGTFYVRILPGNGDGTFRPAAQFPTVPFPDVLRGGDFNGDGNLDLVAARGTTLSILFGLGDGTMAAEVRLSVPSNKSDVLVADLNNDGKSDLLVPQSSNEVAILLSRGDGTFDSAAPIVLQPGSHVLAVGDLNGDGKQDIAAINSPDGVSIYLGQGDGHFVAQAPVPASLRAIAIADFNEDGKADLVGSDQDGVLTFPGNGDGTFAGRIRTLVPDAFSLGVTDFNRDGHLDLAAYRPGSVLILPGHGDGTFSAQGRFAIGPGGVAQTGDLNGDGWVDLVTTVSTSSGTGSQPGFLLVMLNEIPLGP